MSALYPLWKQALMSGDPNADLDHDDATDGPYCALVTSAYSYSDSHQFYTDLTGVLGTDQRISTPTLSATGVFDGDDLAYLAVSGQPVAALVVYRRNSGGAGTWRLVYFCNSAPQLPVSTSGNNVRVFWSANGIFRL